MHCPYCSSPFQEAAVLTKTDQQGQIYECFTCGSHWFPRWLANDISLSQANNVDAITPLKEVTPPEFPRCPQCQTRLSLITHDSIPRGLHIYACPQGHGNFFPKGQLLQFKKAQEAKITYHQLWGVPIKSIFAVLLPVALVLGLAAGIPLTLQQLENSTENRVAAQDPLTTPAVTQIPPDSVILSFTSRVSGTTSVTLYQNNIPVQTVEATFTPSTIHTATFKNLTPNTPYTYVITLKAEDQTFISNSHSLILTQ